MSGSGRPVLGRTMTCRSLTGLSSPLFTCGSSSCTRHWLPCTRSTGPQSNYRAIGEVRPLLAARGFAVPGRPGLRLHTVADVFAYAAAEGVGTALLRYGGAREATRGEQAGDGAPFVSGKKKQNTKKATVITDGEGRTLWSGAFFLPRPHARPDRSVSDRGHRRPLPPVPGGQSQSRRRGTAAWPRSSQNQVQAPPLKPKKDAAPEETAAYEAGRHRQSSERICVEHANAEHKQWRVLQRYPGRREDFDETFLAVSGLISDPRRRAVTPASQPPSRARPDAERAPRRNSQARIADRGRAQAAAARRSSTLATGSSRQRCSPPPSPR